MARSLLRPPLQRRSCPRLLGDRSGFLMWARHPPGRQGPQYSCRFHLSLDTTNKHRSSAPNPDAPPFETLSLDAPFFEALSLHSPFLPPFEAHGLSGPCRGFGWFSPCQGFLCGCFEPSRELPVTALREIKLASSAPQPFRRMCWPVSAFSSIDRFGPCRGGRGGEEGGIFALPRTCLGVGRFRTCWESCWPFLGPLAPAVSGSAGVISAVFRGRPPPPEFGRFSPCRR